MPSSSRTTRQSTPEPTGSGFLSGPSSEQYPEREPFFAHQFCRLLTKAAVAQRIGPEACWLLSVIVHQEDAIHYSRPVDYFNEQLMPLCGFGGRGRLVTARRKAIEAGWLHYEEGGKGKPGTYWVTIPAEYAGIPDGPCDESISRSDSERQTEFAVLKQNGKRTASGRQADGKRAPSNPTPYPTPKKAAPSPSEKLRFSDEHLETARWMLELVHELDPKAKPNLERWANAVRLIEERDGRTLDEIRELFQWAHDDEFWRNNILSPSKLRKQFTALTAKRNGGTSNGSPRPKAKWRG